MSTILFLAKDETSPFWTVVGLLSPVLIFLCGQWFSEQRDIANVRRYKLEEFWMALIEAKNQAKPSASWRDLDGEGREQWSEGIQDAIDKLNAFCYLYFPQLLGQLAEVEQRFTSQMERIEECNTFVRRVAGNKPSSINALILNQNEQSHLEGLSDDIISAYRTAREKVNELLSFIEKERDTLVATPFACFACWRDDIRDLN